MSSQLPDGLPATSAAPQKGSMAIARNAGSAAYERPERARTSHACEPCRERKTKCDGERPSCRRCLHTGNPCHYGFGKGWRKRKTQEDLSSTSQRLARYETLLNEIMPLVTPRVQGMIDEARKEQETIGGSDSAESEPSALSPQPGSTFLPQPSANVFQQGRLPTIPSAYDHARSTGSASANVPHMHRLSSDEQALDRLPSITSTGMLIERDRLAALQHATNELSSAMRPSMSPSHADQMMDFRNRSQVLDSLPSPTTGIALV